MIDFLAVVRLLQIQIALLKITASNLDSFAFAVHSRIFDTLHFRVVRRMPNQW
jgi:hypothetical protein